MEFLRRLDEVAQRVADGARAGETLALIPTMGFLHAGHAALMHEGRKRADRVAVSIFVNPLQFGPTEDLARYPRSLKQDQALCTEAGVDWIFHPEPADFYPPGFQTHVEVEQVSRGLCGERRPGHFRGVATVVTKLLTLFRPRWAIFGEKDFQQLQVIRALCRDLHLGAEIVGVPMVRETDGLALSSRNSYLSSEERERALGIIRGLRAAQHLFRNGEHRSGVLREAIRRDLAAVGLQEDYVEVVEEMTLQPLEQVGKGQSARAMVAAFAGKTRLIDNLPLEN